MSDPATPPPSTTSTCSGCAKYEAISKELDDCVEESCNEASAVLREVTARLDAAYESLASFARAWMASALEQAETGKGRLSQLEVADAIRDLTKEPERQQRLIALFDARHGAEAYQECVQLLDSLC